jgi:hypothetical protein
MDRLHPLQTTLKKPVTKLYSRNKGFRVCARIHASVLSTFSSERTRRDPLRSVSPLEGIETTENLLLILLANFV